MRWLKTILAPKRDTEACAFAEAMSAARAKRKAAWTEYCAARDRGDTREMNSAHRSFRRATHDLMRLELGAR